MCVIASSPSGAEKLLLMAQSKKEQEADDREPRIVCCAWDFSIQDLSSPGRPGRAGVTPQLTRGARSSQAPQRRAPSKARSAQEAYIATAARRRAQEPARYRPPPFTHTCTCRRPSHYFDATKHQNCVWRVLGVSPLPLQELVGRLTQRSKSATEVQSRRFRVLSPSGGSRCTQPLDGGQGS